MKTHVLEQLLDDRRAKRPVVLSTRLSDGHQEVHYPGPDAAEAVMSALRTDRCVSVEGGEDAAVFYQPFNPPLRLMLVGAVHIAQPLSTMASLAGYEVTVIDPREAFAAAERFPSVELHTGWPDEVLSALAPDARSAIVTLTHDPKLDDPALEVALRSEAFYVGSLGSRKTHASRVRRLEKMGFGPAEIERIHAPVGLPIGSRSPAEIAVSVLAQITEKLRKS
ncbi:MAG: XdhC family protein [Myxococcota bacterium]